MTQLSFAGRAFRLQPAEASKRPRGDRQALAYQAAGVIGRNAVTEAEGALLAELNKPASREGWLRLAGAYDQRATAWRLLASAGGDPDGLNHVARAMTLAGEADERTAQMLRRRAGVQR